MDNYHADLEKRLNRQSQQTTLMFILSCVLYAFAVDLGAPSALVITSVCMVVFGVLSFILQVLAFVNFLQSRKK